MHIFVPRHDLGVHSEETPATLYLCSRGCPTLILTPEDIAPTLEELTPGDFLLMQEITHHHAHLLLRDYPAPTRFLARLCLDALTGEDTPTTTPYVDPHSPEHSEPEPEDCEPFCEFTGPIPE